MRNADEKPDLICVRTVIVYPKVAVYSNMAGGKPYIYGISRETGHGIDFYRPFGSEFGKILDALRT